MPHRLMGDLVTPKRPTERQSKHMSLNTGREMVALFLLLKGQLLTETQCTETYQHIPFWWQH